MTDEEFNIPEAPLPPNECPIAELLGKRVVEMNDEELAKYTAEMRTAIESPQSMRKLLANHALVGTKKKTAAKKVDLGILGLL
jgi:hypothetical protein